MIRKQVLCATSVATWLFASGAVAGEAAGDAADSAMLEEIVISAERREAKLQDIAIPITAITGDSLDEKAIKRLDDMQFAAPGLTITTAFPTQAVNIRGVGLASGSSAVTNGVATYVDGVFQPAIVSANSFYDIADVQVFRGPQGTFVGSSSTGGAIFINTRNPQLGTLDGHVSGELGNYSQTGLQGALNLPVGETLALRGAFNHARRDSFYVDHGVFGNEAAKLDELSGRVGVLWKPADSFQTLFKVEYTDKQTGGYAYRPVPTTAFAAGRIGGIRDLNYNTPTRNSERALLNSLELRYTTPGDIVFRSLTGYQDKSVHNLMDADATAIASQRQDQTIFEKVTTQEINIISPTEGRWDWILGGYFQRSEVDIQLFIFPSAATLYPQRVYIPDNKKTVQGYFGQLSFQATDTLEIQLGLRGNMFESEQKSGAGFYINYGAPATPNGTRIANLEGTHDDNEPTGKLSVNWKLHPDHLLYAFVARGYKPGGYNSRVSEFDPETVTDIELGWKATLLDGRMGTALNVFHYDYQNFQAAAIDLATGTNNVTNVAGAKVKGFELELRAQLGQIRIDGGLAYVDSEMDSLTFVNTRLTGTNAGPQCAPGQPTTPGVCYDYIGTPGALRTNSGGVNLYSPEWTYNVGVEYRIPLGNDSTLTPRLNYAFVDSQYVNLLYNDTTDLLESRGLLSAQITYAREKWDVQLYGTNLADKEYISGQTGNNEFYGAPRQYGVRGNFRF